jgi:NAD(P)-dependent dehydrogenase (short-subunit alcohol dehydrogenase family)
MQPLKPIREQAVVVTGASSGIGRATALKFAREGARTVLAARDAQALSDLESLIRSEGGQALAVPTDVAEWPQVEHLAKRAAESFGRIDTWVNNAAVSDYGAFEQIPLEEFRRVMDVNFFGQLHGCRAALPYLKQQDRGALICVGSALADRAVQMQSAYCSAKHAVKAMTESLRVELAEAGSGVQVTLIKPASINTPLFDQAATHMGVKPKPMAPVYEPEIVANAIVYCAEHRTREMSVGGASKLLTGLEAFAGPALDWWMKASGAKGQQAKEPKSEAAPNNLFAPLPGHGQIRGTFGGRGFSLYTLARLHPRATALAAAAVGGAAASVRARRAHA